MRLWFNHWFSTALHLINMIRQGDPEKFYIIGSSTNSHAIFKCACDEWYAEPDTITGSDYVDFCLTFCRKHDVAVFAPRRFLVDIVRNADRFEEIGVKLLADTCADTIEMLDNKIATYAYFKQIYPACVPEVRVAHSFEEFASAYASLRDHASRVCYKLVIDEGARSFRVIDERIEQSSALLEKPGAKITWEASEKILRHYDFSNPMLLMPYLGGMEISADCLSTPSRNIIIPRYKTNKRYSEVKFEKTVMDACSEMMDALGLKMPMNIQFKMDQEKRYLLEINPRMSGGLQLSCQATGINLPSIAVNQLLGIEKEWQYPAFATRKVANIETPICLS